MSLVVQFFKTQYIMSASALRRAAIKMQPQDFNARPINRYGNLIVITVSLISTHEIDRRGAFCKQRPRKITIVV